jgi:hypothetical protein
MSDYQESEEGWYEDFGAQPLSASELDALLEKARTTSDRQLRRLVKEVQASRWLMLILLERAERASKIENDDVLRVARFIVTGEGGIGNK